MWGEKHSTSENIPNNHVKYRNRLIYAFLFLISIIALIIFISNKWNRERKVKGLMFINNEFIPKQELAALIPDSILYIAKERVKLADLKKRIEKYPFVKNVVFSFASNDSLIADITTRMPVAILVANDGTLKFIDKSGKLLPYRLLENFTDLPLLSGLYSGDNIDSARLKSAIGLMDYLSNKDKVFLLTCISEINFSNAYKNLDLYLNFDGVKVMMGNLVDFKEKSEKLQNYLASVYFRTSPKPKVKYIDLRWSNQVVVAESVEITEK